MLFITIPLCLHTQYILELWLKDVPDYTTEFVRIMLIVGLVNTLQNPTMTALHATGNIKKVQIIESTMLLSVVPFAYLFLKYLHISPVMVFVVYLVIEIITQFVRVYMIYPRIKLRMTDYFKKILLPICLVSTVSVAICYITSRVIEVSDFGMLLVAVMIYVVINLTIVFCWAYNVLKDSSSINIYEKIKK